MEKVEGANARCLQQGIVVIRTTHQAWWYSGSEEALAAHGETAHMAEFRQHLPKLLASEISAKRYQAERDYALDDYIQVAFSISPQVRDIQYHHPESLSIEDLYLNYRLSKDVLSPAPAFPTWRDAVLYVAKYLRYVQPGEKVTAELELTPGILRATDGRTCIQLSLTHEQIGDANEVYITADVYNSTGVSDVLKAHHVAPDEVLVKGVSDKLHVYKIGHHHHD
jgi:hypothetical protein